MAPHGTPPARNRDGPEAVEQDVFNEYVSIEQARSDYGVVIDPETKKADLKATEKLRTELR